jgi:hypothetical protein
VLSWNSTLNQWEPSSTAAAGVSSFSAGTTGLTPATGTTGAVTLAGTLAIDNGGTGATTAAAALTALGAVAKTGDTMTGPITITPTTGTYGVFANVTGNKNAAKFSNLDATSTADCVTITASGSGEALSITNTGTTNSLRINGNDFVVSNIGNAGIGANPDATAALTVHSGGIKFSDGSTQTKGAVAKSGDTMTGKLTLGAGGTTSPLNLGASTAPVSPAGGDLWLSSGNVLSYRGYNSATYPLVSTAVLPNFTAGVSTAIGSATVAALAVQQNGAAAAMTVANVSTSTADCVTITNLGSGNSLVVNDDTIPDSTRFAIANNGRVGIGVAPDASVALTVDSTGIKFSDGSVQTTGFFTGSATYDPPSLAAGASTTTTVTCTGALTTHFADATLSSNTGLTINAYVSVANTVTVQLRNDTGATLDVVSGTLKVRTSL